MQATENIKSVALLVHACDRYEFLYKGFEIFFNVHWDSNIPTVNYFATEEKNAQIKPFKMVKSEKGEWSDRLMKLLTHDIKEDYVIYMQEDMWFTKPMNADFFKAIIDYAVDNALDCVKLNSGNVYKTVPTGIDIHGLSLTTVDNAQSNYLMSHQITLWKKVFLLKQLKPNEHPWRNERRATKRMKKANPKLHHIDYFADGGLPEINQNRNPAIRSAYHSISINGLLGNNIEYFIAQLIEQNLDMEYANKLQHNLENNLTHDGKPKPRKEDLMQRFKRWLKKFYA